MREIEIIEEKNAVLVPIEKWEKVQSELVRLRKKVKKAKFMGDLRSALLDLKHDLPRPDYDPADEITADELLESLKNA